MAARRPAIGRHVMRSARTSILFALVALLLALPSSALAVDAGEPEMMEDPVEAMEPEIELAEPTAPAADDVAAQGNAVPEAGAVGDSNADDDPGVQSSGATVAPAASVGSGSGQLPFTGLDSRQLLQLFLVGSVLLSGGVVSLAWASARSETT